MALAIASFMAAVKFHDLTERIANFQEKLFRFVVVEEEYEESFWIDQDFVLLRDTTKFSELKNYEGTKGS